MESTVMLQPSDSVVVTNQLRTSRSPSDRASLDMPVSFSPLAQDHLSLDRPSQCVRSLTSFARDDGQQGNFQDNDLLPPPLALTKLTSVMNIGPESVFINFGRGSRRVHGSSECQMLHPRKRAMSPRVS